MRVARGCLSSPMMTAALSSNLMVEPSLRRIWLRVRTTTALTTLFFLTVPFGAACFTVATMMSPTRA
jgi:hypothetical protein